MPQLSMKRKSFPSLSSATPPFALTPSWPPPSSSFIFSSRNNFALLLRRMFSKKKLDGDGGFFLLQKQNAKFSALSEILLRI